MSDGYGIDLTQFSLARLRARFESGDLLPSHRILAEDIPARFAILAAHGYENVQQLVDALSTKKKMEQFVAATGLPADYVNILRRHVRGYIPGSITLADIPGVDAAHIEALAALGIKHTRHLFARAPTPADRAALVEASGIPATALLELVKLADLGRAGWVGPVFVRMLYDVGAQTSAQLATEDPAALYERLMALNDEHGYTRAKFTVKDLEATIATAQELPTVIVY